MFDYFCRIFGDIIDFMKELEKQRFITRYARQDDNKSHIEQLTKQLDQAVVLFEAGFLDLSLPCAIIYRRDWTSGEFAVEHLPDAYRDVTGHENYIS